MSQSQNIRTSLAPVPASTGKRSGLGLIGSLLLHGAVIAATLFTWQHRLDIADQAPPVVPVELVTIGDKTDIKAVVPKEDKIKLPEKDTAVEAPKVDDTPPPPPQNMAAPKVEVAPPPPKPDAAPPAKQAKSEPVVAPIPAPPVPHMRPRPPAPKKKRAKFDVNKIMALLNKQTPSASQARGQSGEHVHKGIGAQNAMTMDLADALRNQIAQCWNPPVGAPDPDSLVVSFELYLNRDGSIARPPQLTGQSGNGRYISAAIGAARRAIFTCAPYKLPADRYSQWRDITLTFDPRKMMGQ
jgi:outer membrane biosynthesis protein TonB